MNTNDNFPEGALSQAGQQHHSESAGSDSSLDVNHRERAGRAWFRGETDLVAGIFLIVFAALAWWFGQPLKVGTAFRMGPGYVPILLAWVLGAFGVGLVLLGLFHRGPRLERWRFKPMVLVLGALVVFGLTIEGLGLVIASILAVGMSGLAAPNYRMRELALLAIALAAGSALLFPIGLNLPLNIFP